jgi:ribosome recycling factor
MNEEVQMCIEEAHEKMEKALQHLDAELLKIRAGKASIAIFNSVKVNYYGTPTPLNQVANISTPDAKTIAIQPWEKSLIGEIEKAILAANLGFTPMNNGELIRINVPPLTEERRRELTKQVKAEGENAKVSIRNARRDANEYLKKMKKEGLSEDVEKDAETEVQKITDNYSVEVDKLIEIKEKDIMTV